MADTAPLPKKRPNTAAKRNSFRLDFATLAGFALALGGIIGGLLLEKGSIQDVAQGTAAMIVFGGTLGAVLVTTPLPVFRRALRRLGSVLVEQDTSTSETIDSLIQYATKARKNGIVSLEQEAASIPDPFLKKALNLAVDGTDLQEIRQMMEIDIEVSEQASESEAKVWDAAGGYAPTVGIIGAVMGLIQVMKHLEDIKEVGHGIAVAFVATVYGVGSANLFFLPAANKMRARVRAVSMVKQMILEGVVGIVEGLNPTLIRLKLVAFDVDPQKPKKPAFKSAPVKPIGTSSRVGVETSSAAASSGT
ncbi:MAG TPA: flagellar motor protein [Bryobacteraceae bacterium]|nr:flagellar motor protein [Bryobacteraceae bacterium]